MSTDVPMGGYRKHVDHGSWPLRHGVVRCSCGVALYRSCAPPTTRAERHRAASALDRLALVLERRESATRAP